MSLKITVRPIHLSPGEYQSPFAIIGVTGIVINEFWKRADADEFVMEYNRMEAKYV